MCIYTYKLTCIMEYIQTDIEFSMIRLVYYTVTYMLINPYTLKRG